MTFAPMPTPKVASADPLRRCVIRTARRQKPRRMITRNAARCHLGRACRNAQRIYQQRRRHLQRIFGHVAFPQREFSDLLEIHRPPLSIGFQ
jgi:hypothetical protein